MQHVLNSSERNQAFLKFLLFFIITVALVILAIYYNYEVPVKENVWLQDQINNQQIADANQSKFVDKMNEAITLLDQLNEKNSNSELINSKLAGTLVAMQELEGNEKMLYGKMNKAIVAKFSELKNVKKDVSDYAQMIEKQKSDIIDLSTKLNIANAMYNRAAIPTH